MAPLGKLVEDLRLGKWSTGTLRSGYLIKAVPIPSVFDIIHSCAYYSNYVSLIQGHVTPLYPQLKTEQ